MKTPTTNCLKLNCSTLQQQNPSSQRRYQQNRDSREKPSRGKAPAERTAKRIPSRGNAPANKGRGAKGCLEGSGTLYTVAARRWEATVSSQHIIAANEEVVTHTEGPWHTHTIKEGSAAPTLNQGEVCSNHRKVYGCQEKTRNNQQKVHGIHIQPRRRFVVSIHIHPRIRSVVSPNQQAKTKLKNCPSKTSKLKNKIH
jgi:hypothetical protein